MDFLAWFKNKEGEWVMGKVAFALIAVLAVVSYMFGWGQ